MSYRRMCHDAHVVTNYQHRLVEAVTTVVTVIHNEPGEEPSCEATPRIIEAESQCKRVQADDEGFRRACARDRG